LLTETKDGRDGLHIGLLSNYANYLGATKRGAQAETFLNDYMANHPNLAPSEESSLLFSLANVARMSGQPKPPTNTSAPLWRSNKPPSRHRLDKS
jgi:hypothetical protein